MIRRFRHSTVCERRLVLLSLCGVLGGLVVGAKPMFAEGSLFVQCIIAGLCLLGVHAIVQLTFQFSPDELPETFQTPTGATVAIRGLLTAIEGASESIVVTDPRGTIEYVNPAFTELTGYAFREVIGQNPRILKSGRHNDATYQLMWQTIQAGQVWQGRLINRRKDGALYTDQMSITPVRNRCGDIVNYIAIKQDKTEHNATERDKRLLASILQCSQDAIFEHTTGGTILTWDGGAEILFGYNSYEAITRHVSILFAPECQDSLKNIVYNAEVSKQESIGIARDGRRFPISITTSPILEDSGTIVAMSQIIRDISAIKEAEQNRLLLASIVESSEDAIVAATLDGTIVSWNGGAERMFEYLAEEVRGRHVAILFQPSLHHRVPQILAQMKAGIAVAPMETVGQTRSGRLIEVSLTASVLRNSVGKILGVSGIARDITARKRADAELRNAMQAAESANRAKSDFLANMSHEIRTPMNGIVGMTELLLASGLDSTQEGYCGIVRDCSQSLLGILNDILDFSKIEAGKLTLETEDFDLRSIIEGTLDLFALKTQQKGVELLYFLEPDVPTHLRGDPARLRQILINLVGNAVKFTDRGEVAVRVRLDSKADEGKIRIEVADTGTGIPAHKQHLLFQPFFQADSSNSRKFTGTGLGLSIVQRLVGMMGGQAGVTSEEGMGSCFWFTAAFSRQSKAVPPTIDLVGKRVLVISHSATRSLITQLLSRWHCEFKVAPDGADDVAWLIGNAAEAQWDAAIIDLESAEVLAQPARELIEEARLLRQPPVILLTPSSWMIDGQRWESLGVTATVTKPLKHDELGNCLSKVVGISPRLAALRPEAPRLDPAVCNSPRAAYNLLVVEDNPINETVLMGILEHLGYRRVDVVHDGRQAIEALSRTDYDIVLMDCQMPVLDGYEATRLIRNAASPVRNHAVPVIAMTAHALVGDRARCLDAGMNDYIPKPVYPQVLERALDFWTSRLPARHEPPTPELVSPAAGELVFDRDGLLERSMNNITLAQRVAASFTRDISSQLAALSEAVKAADVDKSRLIAHSLKGAAGTVGGVTVRQAASEIEHLSQTGNLTAAETLLPELIQQAEKLRIEIEQFQAASDLSFE